ncbi:MAG: hypothetical protein FWB90_04225 [Fibromonadales bacterium]|nr:hypothetical protein [Fibromonadales bacterium]
MAIKIEKAIKKTLRKSSSVRAWGILFFCVCIVIFAVFLRFFVLSVWDFDGRRIFVCELAFCMKDSQAGDLLLARAGNRNPVLLWQVGKSGDSIEVSTPFDTVGLNIPKPGDTIVFETLTPMLWDASFALYKELNPEKKTKTGISLWSNENEVPFAYVGRASISGRPVSEREVEFLPWQELRLLELQLQRIFPAIDSIHFKRKIFADSLEIESFVLEEELFYLTCEKEGQPKACYDSRERGFFRRNALRGIAQFSTFPLWL